MNDSEVAPGLSDGSNEMSSLHWYPFHVDRWFGSMTVRCMSMEERGVYHEMMNWQWQGQGYLPEDVATLSGIIGVDMSKFPKVLEKFPVCGNGQRANSVLLSIWNKQQDKYAKCSESGRKRWKKDKEILDTRNETLDCGAKGSHEPPSKKAKFVYPPDFIAFWDAYPRSAKKKAAYKAWIQAKDKPSLDVILAAIKTQSESEQWLKNNGQYIPYPSTWINAGQWDDKPTAKLASKYYDN